MFQSGKRWHIRAQPLNENNGHDQVFLKPTRRARRTTVMVSNYTEGVYVLVTV